MQSDLTAVFPSHLTLTLTHNEHKGVSTTVREEIERGSFGYEPDCWVSDEQRQRAIDTDDCWTLQWYPETPIGFCLKSAADLDVLLDAISREVGK